MRQTDPRVRRSRAAIMDATIDLVVERDSSAISMTDLADAAGVSRPVLYQHYGDRDGILVAAMTELIDRELLPAVDPNPANPMPFAQVLTDHFARHSRFYRALLRGSAAFSVVRAITDLLAVPGAELLRQRSDGTVPEAQIREMAKFGASAAAMMLAEWLVDEPASVDGSAASEDPTALVGLLMRIDETIIAIAGNVDRQRHLETD
ncbi:TetR/AcrR family transcriptional regulator [Gordonia sp. (in: high G+C Gram-positive bacteria)]|uniref:TetR/AcrR family transcriptional regulator n=1 Tax=Gordonia sp. (in: high G+C Gram-positive bacteria) TaxID=84139 RepID=UPI0039E301D6